MSDAANPVAHNSDDSDALRDAADKLDEIASDASFGYPRAAHQYVELCDELLAIAAHLRAALSAAPPNDPLGHVSVPRDIAQSAADMLGDVANDVDFDNDDHEDARHIAAALLAALAGAPEGDDDA